MHVQSLVCLFDVHVFGIVRVVLVQVNGYDLQFVEHKHAVESIRRACDEGSTITLLVGHPTDYSVLPIKSIQSTNGHRTPTHNDEQSEFQL
jgi:hypothetical protein